MPLGGQLAQAGRVMPSDGVDQLDRHALYVP
jgi:hypothetical protein